VQRLHERWAGTDAGIGVLGGPASNDLIGVDIDTDDRQIIAALRAALPPTSVKKVGARGATWFFHAPGLPSRSWVIDGRKVVEIISAGRQTVLPPTIHPDLGAPYRWTGSETLEDLRPQDLPKLPADIVERISTALEPFGFQAESQHETIDHDSDKPHRQLNDAAMANLAAWIPALKLYNCRPTRHGFEAVPIWRPSSTGREDRKRNRNLKISPNGIRDFGAGRGYTPIDLVMTALDCDIDRAFTFLSERLGWSTDVSIEIPVIAKATDEQKPAEPTHEQANVPSETTDPRASESLEPLTRVPGLLGDIVDWIVDTARRPSRVLALGAAISVIGTLIGRRAAGPTGSAPPISIS
jgi:hypothetical protein